MLFKLTIGGIVFIALSFYLHWTGRAIIAAIEGNWKNRDGAAPPAVVSIIAHITLVSIVFLCYALGHAVVYFGGLQ